MSPVRIRIQRFNQQSYLGPSGSNCENYFELHPVPEILGSLSMMVFRTSHMERVRTCHTSLLDERNLQSSQAQGWLPVVWGGGGTVSESKLLRSSLLKDQSVYPFP